MKFQFILILTFFCLKSLAQDHFADDKKIRASLGIGFSNLELKNQKLNANSYNVSFLYDFKFGENKSFQTGLDWMSTTSGNLTLQSIGVPFTFKTNISGKFNSLYSGLILKPIYNYNIDFGLNDNQNVNVSKGGNLLVGAKIGSEFVINQKIVFFVDLNVLGDIAQFGYKEDRIIKFKNSSFVALGLNF